MALLRNYNLLSDYDIDAASIEHLILQDKKKAGKDINFVFASGIGNAVVERIPVSELVDFYIRYREKN